MTQILHVPNLLLTQSQRFAFPEESLEIRKMETVKLERLQDGEDGDVK